MYGLALIKQLKVEWAIKSHAEGEEIHLQSRKLLSSNLWVVIPLILFVPLTFSYWYSNEKEMSHITISFEFDRDLIHIKDLANNRDEEAPLVITDHIIKKTVKKWDFFVVFAPLQKLPPQYSICYRVQRYSFSPNYSDCLPNVCYSNWRKTQIIWLSS